MQCLAKCLHELRRRPFVFVCRHNAADIIITYIIAENERSFSNNSKDFLLPNTETIMYDGTKAAQYDRVGAQRARAQNKVIHLSVGVIFEQCWRWFLKKMCL